MRNNATVLFFALMLACCLGVKAQGNMQVVECGIVHLETDTAEYFMFNGYYQADTITVHLGTSLYAYTGLTAAAYIEINSMFVESGTCTHNCPLIFGCE